MPNNLPDDFTTIFTECSNFACRVSSPSLALLCGVFCNNIDRETQQYLTSQIYISAVLTGVRICFVVLASQSWGVCTPDVLTLQSWGVCTPVVLALQSWCVCTFVVLALQSWGVCTPVVMALQSCGFCMHTCHVGFTVMGVSAHLLCWLYSHGVSAHLLCWLYSHGVSAHLLCWF